AAGCRDPRGVPVALPSDPDDDGGGDAGRRAARARQRDRLRVAPTGRLSHGRRDRAEPTAHALHHAGSLSLSRSPPGLVAWREASSRRRSRRNPRCGRVNGAFTPRANRRRPAASRVGGEGTVTVTRWLGADEPYSIRLWTSSHTTATAFR